VITNLRIFQATIMPQITNEIVVEYNTNVTTTGSSSGTYIMLNSWEFLPLMIFWVSWLSKDLEKFFNNLLSQNVFMIKNFTIEVSA